MAMEHKGYVGTVQYSDEDRVFHGAVAGIRDRVTFEGTSVDEIETAFREAVDDYLDWCARRGEEPNKPFSGKFVLRTAPEVHQAATLAAARAGKSLNAWAADVIAEAAR
jgi:predicted HicB family RNase H-like nuclease